MIETMASTSAGCSSNRSRTTSRASFGQPTRGFSAREKELYANVLTGYEQKVCFVLFYFFFCPASPQLQQVAADHSRISCLSCRCCQLSHLHSNLQAALNCNLLRLQWVKAAKDNYLAQRIPSKHGLPFPPFSFSAEQINHISWGTSSKQKNRQLQTAKDTKIHLMSHIKWIKQRKGI